VRFLYATWGGTRPAAPGPARKPDGWEQITRPPRPGENRAKHQAYLSAGPAAAPLPDDQCEGLRNNIAVNGVLVPILTDGGSPVRLVNGAAMTGRLEIETHEREGNTAA
jgi:hypothetical protein